MILKVFAKEEDFENEFVRDIIDRATDDGYDVESYDIDSEEAHVQAEIYDIMTSPSFVVAGSDGREVEVWRGKIPAVGDIMEFMAG
jgi:hypothetical protein